MISAEISSVACGAKEGTNQEVDCYSVLSYSAGFPYKRMGCHLFTNYRKFFPTLKSLMGSDFREK